MREFLSEALRFVESRAWDRVNVPEVLHNLVYICNSKPIYNYYAVDSGYIVLGFRGMNVLVQSLVAVGPSIDRKISIRPAPTHVNLEARLAEISFAEGLPGITLVDGPLTPYVSSSKSIGVSKDPRKMRYGPRIRDPEARDVFLKLSGALGELGVASMALARAPRGSYLAPVDLGNFLGTFFKSDVIIYVEYPKTYAAEDLCGLFRRYPIKLRVAHRLASINKKYIKTIKIILSRLDRNLLPQNREFI